MKDAPCLFTSLQSSSPSSLKRVLGTRRDCLCHRSRRRRFAFLLPRLLPQGRPCADIRCCVSLHGILPRRRFFFFSAHLALCALWRPCYKFGSYLDTVHPSLRGGVCRGSARFRQARKPILPACGRVARSARRPAPSAKRAVEQCVLTS